MSTGEKTRVDWVDIAKGICIIFVVMMHSVLGVEEDAGARGPRGGRKTAYSSPNPAEQQSM